MKRIALLFSAGFMTAGIRAVSPGQDPALPTESNIANDQPQTMAVKRARGNF